MTKPWCDLCNAAHPPCEPPDYDNLIYDCVRCFKPITDPDDETDTDLGWMHRECRIIHELRVWASLRSEHEDEPSVLTAAADALDAYRKRTGGLPPELIAKVCRRAATIEPCPPDHATEFWRGYSTGWTAAGDSLVNDLCPDELAALRAATFEVPT